MYDYRLDDAGISSLEEGDEDEERKVNGALSYRFLMQPRPSDAFLFFTQSSFCLYCRSSGSAGWNLQRVL